jgi:hypothetical protein
MKTKIRLGMASGVLTVLTLASGAAGPAWCSGPPDEADAVAVLASTRPDLLDDAGSNDESTAEEGTWGFSPVVTKPAAGVPLAAYAGAVW